MEIVEGGFFLREKPLGFNGSVQSRIENAVARLAGRSGLAAPFPLPAIGVGVDGISVFVLAAGPPMLLAWLFGRADYGVEAKETKKQNADENNRNQSRFPTGFQQSLMHCVHPIDCRSHRLFS